MSVPYVAVRSAQILPQPGDAEKQFFGRNRFKFCQSRASQ